MMPPTDIEIGKEYSTVGIEYAYLNQRDSLAGNHSITENYWDAVVNGKPNDAKRNYPIKAID